MTPGAGVAGSTRSWPALNARVTVVLGFDGTAPEAEVVTRVEDVDEDGLVIAAPRFAGDLDWATTGREVQLAWGSERGACFQRFVLAALDRGALPCWRLRPTGPVTTEQRRRYARAAVTGRALLEPVPLAGPAPALQSAAEDADAAGEGPQRVRHTPPDPVAVRLLDLSEGGARVLHTGPAEELVPGTRARMRTDVDGVAIDQVVTVLRTRPAASQGAAEVVLSFVEPVPHADHLRRYVLRAQIENRRRGER
ncbi:PilZ domain-containing protein [Kineococcus glutinatus]|uniref:PilZ domain-containing protein n=1 Tax=Kineococcus glutinatus TaxID=1070872 RepID=A0ABP8VIC6_9ACTN